MMGDCKKKSGVACRLWSPSSSSWSLLLLFVVPLLVVSGFVAVLGPKTPSWDFITSHPWIWWYSKEVTVPVSAHAKEYGANGGEEQKMGLHPSTVVVVVVGAQSRDEEEKVLSDESHHNSSSTPPLAVEPIYIQEPNATVEDGMQNARINETSIAPSPNEFPDLLIKTRRQKEFSNLEKLEAGLQKARAAIKEASEGNQTYDLDYVPLGPMYWNAKVFQRSYLEMQRQFKVFVYGEGEPPVFHNGPCKSIYSMEGNFIHRMEIDGQFRTKDPEKAHVFFLPFSVAMMVQFVYVRDSHDFDPIRRTVRDYVGLISSKYPYWNRSLGADHFMLACHDWGPETSFSIPHLAKNSIRALCNANTSEGFNPIKDVSFPEINLQTGTIRGFVGGPSPSKRSILAFFAGGLHGPIRPRILEHWENKDDDIRVHRYLPKGVSYYEMMRRSKFCLCPSGYEVASPRVVEAIYTGCVPVLISDHYVPPFSDVLNWKSFSVEVLVSDIPNLKRVLTSISPRQYIRMQRRVLQVRRHFEVNSPPKRYDVFHMILHSIWLRRLNVKISSPAD